MPLSADGAGGPDRDLSVSWDGCAEIALGVVSDAVASAFAQWFAAVRGEVTLELAACHAAAGSIVIVSAWPPPIGGSRPSAR